MSELVVDGLIIGDKPSEYGFVDIDYSGSYGPGIVAEIDEEKALKIVEHLCKVFYLGHVVAYEGGMKYE